MRLVCLLIVSAISMMALMVTADDDDMFSKIEGKVTMPRPYTQAFPNWQLHCRVLVGDLLGFVAEDGTFSIGGVPVGSSYVVEVTHPDILFESVRVDITSKGKMRARKVNLMQPSQVNQVSYPLRVTPRQPWQYFRKREEWRVSDVLMNPMVLMMVVPMLIFMVLPKLINTNDPELQKEMQESMQMPKVEMPDMADMMTNWFGGGSGQKKAIKNKPTSSRRS